MRHSRVSLGVTPRRAATALALIATLSAGARLGAQEREFRRGDSNADATLDISDPSFTLDFLFRGGPVTPCLDAADSNDDGSVDVSDPVAALIFLFGGGAPLPAPGRDACGPDPTADTLGCAQYAPCDDAAPRVVATIVLEPTTLSIELGATGALDALALDADGEVIPDATIQFVSTSSERLPVTDDGEVTGGALGFHSVVAVSGDVVSEPATVIVFDPRGQESAPLAGSVVTPPELDGHALRVTSPLAAAPVAADGSFVVERLTRRNQMMMVIDDDTGATIWLGLSQGSLEDEPPAAPPLVLGPASTAEALLFLVPAILHSDPLVLEDFRLVVPEMPEFGALVALVQAASLDWPQLLADGTIGAQIDVITRELFDALPEPIDTVRRLALAADGDLPPFEPAVNPAIIGGIKVETVPTGRERVVDLRIENTLLRQVDIFLERVLPDGSRPAAARGPFQMGSMAALVPSAWELLAGKRPLANDVITIPGVDFDPRRGGARQWRVYAYGFGLLSRLHPDLTEDRLARRLAPVFVRSFILDIAFNVVTLLTTVGPEAFKTVIEDLNRIILGGVPFQILANRLAEQKAVSEQVIAVIDFLGSQLVAYLKSPAFAAHLARVLEGAALTAVRETVEKLSIVLEAWSLLSALSKLVGFGYAIGNSAVVEIIRVDDISVSLEPTDGPLPTAFTGCPYDVELEVKGGQGPFTWNLDEDAPASLTLVPIGGPEFRKALLRTDEFKETSSPPFFVEVLYPPDPRDPEDLILADSRIYTLQVQPPQPIINEITFPAGNAADPGGTIAIQVDATHCVDVAKISGGTVSSPALTGVTPLAIVAVGADSVRLTAVVTLRRPLQDRPVDLADEQVTVTVTDVDGGLAKGTKEIDIKNVAPSMAKGSKHQVRPGEVFQVTVDVQDDNQDGTRTELFGSDVSANHPSSLLSTPRLDDLDFARTVTNPSSGEMKFASLQNVFVHRPQPDNDGITSDAADDAPALGGVQAIDDDGASAGSTVPVEVVVRNVAPAITDLRTVPAVLPERGTVSPRPLEIRAQVADDNGSNDIGAVVLDLSDFGVAGPVTLGPEARISSNDTSAVYRHVIPDVQADCTGGCRVIATAIDADDVASNEGFSAPVTVVVPEMNLPPTLNGDGIIEPFGPTGSDRCPGHPMKFAVMAIDPNGDTLAVDLVLDGEVYPMTPTPGSPNTFQLERPAGDPGAHEYFFRIRELLLRGASTIDTPVEQFEVEDCSRPATPSCPPGVSPEEVCDGVDNDCNGAVDDGLPAPCGPVIHTGEFSVSKLPVCPGDPVVLRAGVVGPASPYTVLAQILGPQGRTAILAAQTDAQGNPTGRYEATIPAPLLPGAYTITYIIQSPATTLQVGQELVVSPCTTPPLTVADDIELAMPGFETTFDVRGNDAVPSGAGFFLVDEPAIHGQLFTWNGDGTFTVAPSIHDSVVQFTYKAVFGSSESETATVQVFADFALGYELEPFTDPDTGIELVSVPVLVIDGKHYPGYQFHLFSSIFAPCGPDPHWQNATLQVSPLEDPTSGLSNPDAGGCGFGVYADVPRDRVIVESELWGEFLELRPPPF